ncbi:MAG: NADH-quinone oxidoreductase subunit J [Deltaproteobacteria bacterium]|nr:NADH-quinone oxidoreductase subunit J [Deltaproteobacteria bacterium]
MNTGVFVLLATLLVVAALGVVLARSPIRSALSLVVALFFLAVFFLLLDAQLIAALQVIVYAGAIMVLFLFVIMLLNLQEHPAEMARAGLRFLAGTLASLFLLATIYFTNRSGISNAQGMGAIPDGFDSTAQIAERLFTQHLFAFELTSLLLLVAIISAVVLAKKKLA